MDEPDAGRPTALLPLGQLVRLSVYWLGLVAVVQGIGITLQERITVLVPDTSIQYTTLGALQVAGIVIAVLVQPTVGTLSDYTISRFGRRKPYIVIGTVARLRVPGRPRDLEHGPRRRRVRDAAPVQLELRSGPVPGLRARPRRRRRRSGWPAGWSACSPSSAW